jgi:hypothetical protein
MIDITPYQQKLTWLQEWIELRIDKWVVFWIIREWYERTGNLMRFHPDDDMTYSFESYCDYKQQQEANIKYVAN